MGEDNPEGSLGIREETGEDGSTAAEEKPSPPSPRPLAAEELEELEELRKRAAERDEYLDLLKRSRADFANYQKRVEKERKRWGALAQRDLLARLLVASDQCRLAARKAETDTSAESLRDAICLVWSEVEKFLEVSGTRVIPTVGESFNPDRHEAVSVAERDDVPDSTVVEEVRPGYEFDDLVLRAAQVVVSKRPRPAEAEGDGTADEHR